MKTVRLHPLLPAAIFTLVWIAAGRAEEKRAEAILKQALQAKIEYCKTCHGISGQGFRGAYPMPRLAGQQPEYLENQLRAFIERRRANPVMFNVAHVLSPSMVEALAEHFKDLNPKPLGGAPKELEAAGKKFTKKDYPMPTYLHALPVMVQRQEATEHFPGLQGSCMTTSLRSW
jgi:cytochrome c553